MSQPAKKTTISVGRPSWPPELEADYRSWMVQAEVFRASGHVNEALFARLVEELAWKQEFNRHRTYENFKFAIEWIGALLLTVTLSPVLIGCIVINKLTSRGPAMFYQLRCGQNAKPIWVYKFRTFRLESQNQVKHGAPMAKPANSDPYTRFGKILRNWRLDELPQLINVLRGEMSLVGPRPLSLEDSVTIPRRYYARFTTRPGLTGLWQATRPNTISAHHKLRFDCYYVRRRSARLDFWLLAKTFKVGLTSEERFSRIYFNKRKQSG